MRLLEEDHMWGYKLGVWMSRSAYLFSHWSRKSVIAAIAFSLLPKDSVSLWSRASSTLRTSIVVGEVGKSFSSEKGSKDSPAEALRPNLRQSHIRQDIPRHFDHSSSAYFLVRIPSWLIRNWWHYIVRFLYSISHLRYRHRFFLLLVDVRYNGWNEVINGPLQVTGIFACLYSSNSCNHLTWCFDSLGSIIFSWRLLVRSIQSIMCVASHHVYDVKFT